MGWQYSKFFKTICRVVLITFYLQTLHVGNLGYRPGDWGLNWHLGFNEAAADDSVQPPAAPAPQPQNLAPDDYLSPTPDANSADPYIIQKAQELGNDPAQIFTFVRDEIGYESYKGSLRGARGTLWSKAGNSLDKASLMIALLRASNIPARYAQGTLTTEQARELILSMFPALLRVVGCPDETSKKTNPAADPTLLAETQEHFWVEMNSGSGFQAVEASFTNTETIGSPVTTASAVFNEIPDTLRHKIKVRLKKEITTPLSGLFGTSSQDLATVLEQQFNTVELVGRQLSLGHFVNTSSVSAVITAVTNTYSPYILIGNNDNDLADDTLIRGQDYQETLTNFPFGSQILTGVFLETDVIAPDGSSNTYQRTLIDRIGFDVRQNGESTQLSADVSGAPIINESDVLTINALPGLQSQEQLIPLNARVSELQGKLDQLQPKIQALPPSGPYSDEQQALIVGAQSLARQLNISTNETTTIAFTAASDIALQQLEKGYLTEGYYNSPRLILAHTKKEGDTVQVSLDIRKNDLRAVPAPGQVANTNLFFEFMRGLFESTLEGEIVAKVTGQPATSITEIFSQKGADNRLTFLSPDDLSRVNSLALSNIAKSRIASALSSGKSVLTPANMVTLNNRQTVGWLETDWRTGQTISVMEDGGHSGVVEYAFVANTINSPHNLAMGAFIGTLSGFAVTQLAFTAELIGSIGSNKALAEIVKQAKINIGNDVINRFISDFIGALGTGSRKLAGLKGLEGPAMQCFGGAIGLFIFPPSKEDATKKPLYTTAECLRKVITELGLPGFDSGLGMVMKGGMLVGMAMGIAFISYNYPGDPPVFPFLSIPLADGPAPSQPESQPGVELNVVQDSLFFLPVNNAELPSVFKAQIHNTGPGTDTFNLNFSNVPAGFTAQSSLPAVTIPAGETAEIGVCLRPQADLPAPGTPADFQLDVISASNPSVNAASLGGFQVPELNGIDLTLAPTLPSTIPGGSVTATLSIKATGNIPQTINLSSEVSSGLTVQGLDTQTLQPGDSINLPLTLTTDNGIALGTVLNGVIKAEVVGVQAPVNQLVISLLVAAPGSKAIANAAISVGQIGNQDLADRLNDLGRFLNSLAQNPDDNIAKNQALAALDSIIKQLTADPFLSEFVDEFTAAKQALEAVGTPEEIVAALNGLGSSLNAFGTTTTQLGLHNFETSLAPPSIETQPNVPAPIGVRIRNTGSSETTYNVSFENLPADTSGAFNQSSVTLLPGQLSNDITASLTRTAGNELLPASFKVRVTAGQAPAVSRLIEGNLTVRNEFVSVASVTANPPFVNPNVTPPIQIFISAKILNAVNRARNALVSFKVKNSNGQEVFASSPVNTALSVQTALTDVDLGAFNPQGLPEGTYTAEVNVTDTDGTPIPGGTGTGNLLLGSPVTASLSNSPDKLPPGDSTVTHTLKINSQLILPPLSVEGQIHIPSGSTRSGVAVKNNIAYACSANGIQLFDVTDSVQPVWLKTVGSGQNIGCKIQSDLLLALGLPSGNTGSHTLQVYSLKNDPLTPVLLGSSPPVNYNLQTDLVSNETSAFVAQFSFCNFLHNNDVFAQTGDLLSIPLNTNDLIAPTAASPALADVLFNTHGDNTFDPNDVLGCAENGGDGNVWQLAVVDENTLLMATTTIKGTDTQTGIGRVLVIDTSDPANLSIVKEVQIPGTAHAIGIAVDGDRALIVSSTGGWRDFFSNSDPDNDVLLTGNLVFSTLLLTDPRNPILLASQPISRQSRTFWNGGLTSLGNGRFSYSSLGGVNDAKQILMIDANDPFNLVFGQTDVPAENIGPNAITANGDLIYTTNAAGDLIIYRLPDLPVVPVKASVKVPNNTGVTIDSGSVSEAPSEIIQGNGFDTLVWERNLTAGSSLLLNWQTTINNLQPGEARQTTQGGTVDFTFENTPGQVPLSPTTVVSEQLLTLDPNTQTVRPGESALYNLSVKNPAASPVRYDLSIQGIPASWAQLASPLLLEANEERTIALPIAVDPFTATGLRSLVITARGDNGARGAVQGDLLVEGDPVIPAADSNAHGVIMALTPANATAGQGTSARYTVRVINTGSSSETFRLDTSFLPANFVSVFDSAAITVPPGASNYRDVGLTVTPPADTPPTDYPFSVQAVFDANNEVGTTSQGLLTVVNAGVSLAFNQVTGNPGETLFLNITNTGTIEDDFMLSLLGPGGLISSLSDPSVRLLPGASATIGVTLGNVDFALPGSLSLFAKATSGYDSAVQALSQANISVAERKGLSATLDPAVVDLAVPGTKDFLVKIKNTGNVEDAYSATISQVTGPVSASLEGLDGNPTQSIPVFRLPALADGSLNLGLSLNAAGTGIVKVLIASNTEPSIQQELTAQLGVVASNQAPIADAGPNKNVFTGVPSALDGSASTDPDGDLISYLWRFVSVPVGSGLDDSAIINRQTSSPLITPDLAGIYRLELIVSDGFLDSLPAYTELAATNANVPPNAIAGQDQTVLVGETAVLDGSLSQDPDGSPAPLSFNWSFIAVPALSVLGNDSITSDPQNPAKVFFTPDVKGSYELKLRASDGVAFDDDTLTVTATLANVPPVANAGDDLVIQSGDVVNLNAGLSHDSDQGPSPLSFSWRFVSMPVNSALPDSAIVTDSQNPAKASFIPDQPGDYVLEVKVSDGEAVSTDNILVKILPALRYQDINDLFLVTPSNEKTVLNRQTRKLTSSVTLTLTNISALDIKTPIRALFGLPSSTISIPGATVDQNSGQLYLELPGNLIQPGGTEVLNVQFVYPAGTQFRYDTRVFGKVAR